MKQKVIALFLIIVMVASALTAVGLTTTTTVAAATATTTTMTASKTNPVVNEPVTFTVTLKSGTTWLSAPIKIWHTTPDGKRWEDGIHIVNGVYKFNQAFTSGGKRIYHAEYAGNSQYGASSGAVTVNVLIPTITTLSVSKTNPVVGEQVTFTAQLLKWNGASWVAVTWEGTPQLKIIHYVSGVPVTDWAQTTRGDGKITWTKSYGSTGTTTYYAYFAGNPTYGASKSAGKTVTVKIGTTLTIYMGTAIDGTHYLYGWLKETHTGRAVTGRTIEAYVYYPRSPWWSHLGSATTDANGYYTYAGNGHGIFIDPKEQYQVMFNPEASSPYLESYAFYTP